VTQPSRAAPARPKQPNQPAVYSVSADVAILPDRAAPMPPLKPPPSSQPPAKPPKPGASEPTQPSQPPPKPPRPGASEPPTESLDPRLLRAVAAPKGDANRPPLPQKPAVS